MDVKIHESWKKHLAGEFEKPYFKELVEFVRGEYEAKKIYPPPADIFRAFEWCPFEKVKVVILGQDPYHGPQQAHGLCFSVRPGVQIPPSLMNIYKELKSDLGIDPPKHGNLEKWAEQGILLLNASLTVQAGNPGSHHGKGWEQFTSAAVKRLNDEDRKSVV